MTRAALTFAAIAIFAAAGAAQPARTDPLGPARTAQRIADQKVEALVRKAIADAENLRRSRPDKAVQYLKSAQLEVDLSAGISTETRKALTAQLKAKLAAAEGRPLPGAAAPGVKLDPRGAAVRTTKQAVWEGYVAEVKAVNEGIAQIKHFQETNQTAAAARIINNLAAKYPDNPAVIALTRKGSFQQAIDDAQAYNRMSNDRMLKAQNAPLRASLPPNGDVEFPADWKEKAGKRESVNAIKLTDKEKRIIEALDKPVTIIGKDKPIEYLLQELSTAIDQPLLIDKASLHDLDIDLKQTASLEAQGVSARTALRQLLAAQGLTYIIQNETIQVVTVAKAKESLTTRVYYLGDVVQGVGPFGGGATWGPFLDFQQTMTNVNTIIDAIQDSVDPQSWKKRGGPATITFHFPSMSLIVRASSEVHSALGSKLGGRR